MSRPNATALHDNRIFQRYEVRGEARIEPLDERSVRGLCIDVRLRDISRTGVMFAIEGPIDVDSMWRMRLIDSGHAIGSVPILVRYCRSASDGAFEVGAQFMIEPYILNVLGVATHRLVSDECTDVDPDSCFEPPPGE